MSSTRYVVSRRTAGLGDLLVNLVAAWDFAARTGRTLVADWRGSRYLQDRTGNLFGALFEPTDRLAGVPLEAPDDLSGVTLPEPYHPEMWTRARLERPPLRSCAEIWADRDAAVALIRGGGDVEAATVVLDGCINHALPSAQRCRAVLADLRPVGQVRAEVEGFSTEHLAGRPVVAVHLRHANGGAIGDDHDPFWADFDAAVDRCAAAARGALERLGDEAVVFLATDATVAADAFLARLPEAVARPKFFRREGDGELHAWQLGFVTRAEALIDMLLLAEGDALVRFPPGSFFSFWASLMKRRPPAGSSPVQSTEAGPLAPLVVW